MYRRKLLFILILFAGRRRRFATHMPIVIQHLFGSYAIYTHALIASRSVGSFFSFSELNGQNAVNSAIKRSTAMYPGLVGSLCFIRAAQHQKPFILLFFFFRFQLTPNTTDSREMYLIIPLTYYRYRLVGQYAINSRNPIFTITDINLTIDARTENNAHTYTNINDCWHRNGQCSACFNFLFVCSHQNTIIYNISIESAHMHIDIRLYSMSTSCGALENTRHGTAQHQNNNRHLNAGISWYCYVCIRILSMLNSTNEKWTRAGWWFEPTSSTVTDKLKACNRNNSNARWAHSRRAASTQNWITESSVRIQHSMVVLARSHKQRGSEQANCERVSVSAILCSHSTYIYACNRSRTRAI